MAKKSTVKVKSKSTGKTSIGAALRQRRAVLDRPIGAKIIIPTGGSDPASNALEWVLWQEFGTGTKRVAVPEFGISAGDSEEYPIPGEDNPDPALRMRFPPWKGRTYGFRMSKGKLVTPKGYIITHPGIAPKKFIRGALAEIRQSLRIGIGNALAKGFAQDSDSVAIEGATIVEMEKVKQLIVKSMRSAFGRPKRPDGRLNSIHPSTVFKEFAQVVGMNVDAFADEHTGTVNIKSFRSPSLAATKRAKFKVRATKSKLTSKSREKAVSSGKGLTRLRRDHRNK